MTKTITRSTWSRFKMRWLIMGSLLTAVLGIILISAGIFDPQPIGEMQWQRPLPAQTIPAQTSQIIWLDQLLPDEPYSLRLTAAYQTGAKDTGYGLALGDETAYTAVALSPLGNVTIFSLQPSAFSLQPSAPLPWQPWPHVRTGNTPNEIWVDVAHGRMTVRINREWLWAGDVSQLKGKIGLWGESFGETAVVDWQTLQLFK